MKLSFKAPPQGDFDAYAKWVRAQRLHFAKLADYSASQCSNADGLDGLLSPLRGSIASVGDYFHGKFAHCVAGMTTVSGRMVETGQYYHRSGAPGFGSTGPERSKSTPKIGFGARPDGLSTTRC